MRKIILALLCCVSSLQVPAVGTWKAYMAYHDITQIEEAGTILYVLASQSLYAYNTADGSVQLFDKATNLNGTDIAQIAWCQAARKLVVVYADGNIDLILQNGDVESIPGYYNAGLSADKTVNSLLVSARQVYMATGFGIVRIDVEAAEIADTYNLGFGVNYCYIEDSRLFAASARQGLYSAALTANPADRSVWQRVGDYIARTTTVDARLLAKVAQVMPGGPRYNHFYELQFLNNRLYSTGGQFASGRSELFYPGTVQVLEGGNWTVFQDDMAVITGYDYVDVNTVAVDPKDGNHVFAGGRTGLYEFYNGRLRAYYNKDNSLLQGAMDRGKELGNNYVLVNGMAFDAHGTLWLLNSQTKDNGIINLTTDGTFTLHPHTELQKDGVGFANMRQAFFDSQARLWFVNENHLAPALVCYRTDTDRLTVYTRFTTDDGSTLSPYYVQCAAEDRDGNIWVGTDVGLLQLNADVAGMAEAVFSQVKVPRNDGTNLADYLLNGTDIRAIAIDGAGRKWIGTQGSGVFLISADNLTQEAHYTADNSALLSDNVQSIAIDGTTGEVYFATDKGLCSYAGDATTPTETMTKGNVYAYPNPVRPGYAGLITVVGLSYDADVKIVSASGQLVKQGRSNGGTFTWDGTGPNGRRVPGGVYMVLTATATGSKGTVCKIAVVN